MRLTSWHGGSGRLEEGWSPAQAAWQPASTQQQSQTGLQGGESRQRGAPGGRPRPLPCADPGAPGSISVRRRLAGRRKGSFSGGARSDSGAARAARSARRSPLPDRPLTARLRSRQPAPVLPSRWREGPWGAARGRDAGRGRGIPGAGGAGRRCGPAQWVLRSCAAAGDGATLRCRGPERPGSLVESLIPSPRGPPGGALQG